MDGLCLNGSNRSFLHRGRLRVISVFVEIALGILNRDLS